MQPVAPDAQDPPGGAGRRLAADHDRGRLAQELGTQALSEAVDDGPPEGLRQLPWREVEEGDHDRDPRGDRQRAASDSVVDGARRATAFGPPRRPDGRAAQHERVHGHRTGAEEPGRRQLSSAHDVQVVVAIGRVVQVGRDQERERFAVERLCVVRPEQVVEVDGRERRSVGRLEGSGVEDDADADRAIGRARAQALRRDLGHRRVTPRGAGGSGARRAPRREAGRRRRAPRRRSGGSSSTGRCAGPGR